MHGVISKIKKEGLLFITVNEGNRLLTQARGQIAFIIDAFLVAVERVGKFTLGITAQIKITVTASAHKLIGFIKAARHGMPFKLGIIII